MPIKVLIVDDIADTRDNVRRLLSLSEEFRVIGEAANGKLALQQVERLSPDIVLMDVNMPEMDGITACKRITDLYPECGIIMMTVQGGTEYIRRSFEMGAKGYVIKPFSSQELMTAIREIFHTNHHQSLVGKARTLSLYQERQDSGIKQVKGAGISDSKNTGLTSV